jgi:hypothetical protein
LLFTCCSAAFGQCKDCPVVLSTKDPKPFEEEAKNMVAVTDSWARVNEPNVSLDQYIALQKRLAIMLSATTADMARKAKLPCEKVTEQKATETMSAVAKSNPFLREKLSAQQFSRDRDKAVDAALFMHYLFQIMERAKDKEAWDAYALLLCAFGSEEILQAYVSEHAEIGYHNYLLYRAHLRANPRGSDPTQAAFNKLGINKCDKWAADKSEWANSKVDMSPTLLNDGAPRKFWGTITAGNSSELILHYAGGGAFGALMDRVGVTASSGSFANIIIKVTPKTVIATRNIRVGGGLVGYGKQISTRDIQLADRSRSTAAVVEAVCLEGF